MKTDGYHRTSRYIMTRTHFGGSELPDDEDIDGPRNFGLVAIQPPDAAASPRIFYCIQSPRRV